MAIIGFIMLAAGRRKFKSRNLAPTRTDVLVAPDCGDHEKARHNDDCRAGGGGKRLMDYRQSIPDVRAPLGVVRPFVGSATRKTLAELRAEMLRRKQEAERGTVREKAEG